MYLVDTNIISITSPTSTDLGTASDIRGWLSRASDSLFMSAVSIGEIEAGIAKSRRNGSSRKAASLSDWLDLVLHIYSDRILPLDTETARITGRLLDAARGSGGGPEFEDAAIAATAKRWKLTVLTRNVRHFQMMDVAFHNPFTSLPPL